MRADRLLNILLMLQETPRLTARDAAQRLEVSPRTIHRDMEALSMAGIPVYAERGRDGGYALLDDFRTELNYLTGAEIQALFVNNLGILKDLGLKQAAESGGQKLQRALPDLLGRDAARVRRHILVDGAGWRQTAEEHPFLTLLHDALWQGRQVRMDYQRADGSSRARVIHPLGLVAKGRLWYLVAHVEEPATDAANGAQSPEPRTYRVSRIGAAEILAQPARVPPDFDLAAYWEASSSRFVANLPRYPVEIWASPEAVRRLPTAGWYVQVEAYAESRGDGWQRVQLAFHTPETAISCLIGFGDQVEIIQPDEVAEGILRLARGICEKHQRNFP
jgi:predicted DNA-binding transcriptional regulator YafY